MPDKPSSNPLKGNGLDPFVMPWFRNGDDIWCTFDSNFGLENYDTYVFRSTWAALTDPCLQQAPCTYAYYGGSRYYRWLGMGDRPGYLRWRVSSAQTTVPAEVPDSTRTWAEARFPGLLANPRAFSERAVIYRPEGTEPVTP